MYSKRLGANFGLRWTGSSFGARQAGLWHRDCVCIIHGGLCLQAWDIASAASIAPCDWVEGGADPLPSSFM